MTKYQIAKGDTFRTEITVTSADGTATDLTGATVVMTVFDRNGVALETDTTTSHSDPTNGKTIIVLTAAETSDDPFGCYDFDIKVTLADTEKFTVDQDQFEITE